MVRTVQLKLTGKAEQFLNRLEQEGLTERDVFAKALSVLRDVHETKRVGLISEGYENTDIVEFFYGINVSQAERKPVSPEQDELDIVLGPGASTETVEEEYRVETGRDMKVRPARPPRRMEDT